MDSWTLQGDSYSFLRSAPRTFSLCHRDGTPNHVEIFDIINVPSQRSVISETTCLCDIFGDDCEAPSIPGSPAVRAFVPPQREVDGTAAASPLADDLNESSGSYHTAPGSSEGEEGFEDSAERLYSPVLQSECVESRQTEGEGLHSGHLDVSGDCNPHLEPQSVSPVSQLSEASPSVETFNAEDRTTSPGHKSPYTLRSEGTASSLSSSSIDKQCSPSSPSLPNLLQVQSEAEEGKPARKTTPTLKDGHNSPSQSLTPSPSPETRNCISSCSSESVHAQFVPEPRNSSLNQCSTPSSEHTPTDLTQDFTESAVETKPINLSLIHPPSSAELSSQQEREAEISPEAQTRSYSPDTQASSPFSELRGRVSLPDLFSRGSTPDIDDSPHTPEPTSDLSTAERYSSASPESQGRTLSAEPVSAVSTPAPRYTPPSPVISIATSTELVESAVSPEFIHTAPSPDLLAAASPAKSGDRSPSPGPSLKIRHIQTPPATGTQVPLSVVSSLSPSPEVTNYCSPSENRFTAPSPEIRITASSPELNRRQQASEEASLASASPLLEPLCESTTVRSLTSSPHITGISYAVVQPEDRESPPFPELCHFSSPEPERTAVSPDARSLTPSRDSRQSSKPESIASPRNSPHIPGFASDKLDQDQNRYHTPSPQPRHRTPSPQPSYHTPSPQPNFHTPSPQPISQAPACDRYQGSSPQHRSKEASPVAQYPELRYHQTSPAQLSPVCTPQYPQLTPPPREEPEIEGDSSSANITEIQYPTHLATDSVVPSFELDKGDKRVVSETKSRSPVELLQSFVSPSAFSETEESLLIQQSTERKTTSKQTNIQNKSNKTSSEEKGVTDPTLFQREDNCNITPIEIKSSSPNRVVSKERSPTRVLVHSSPAKLPVQRPKNPQSQFPTYSLPSESSSSLKSTSTAGEHKKRQSSTVRRENKDRFTEDMAHHVNRRRTPSPPLTRFTPVHIIAPEKPIRHWQNRSSSPSQVVASSQSSNSKKVVTNRESPKVAPIDNNSQAQWVRLGTQLEMEREMQLEEARELGRNRHREMERERKREEQLPEKGKGWQGDACYRGEQVELSFTARNRKGPVSRRAAPTSRESRQGLPAAHSYSESLLATRQLQQQQSLLRLASQQDTRGSGGSSRRLQPPAQQNKSATPGRTAINRPGRSSSSSMGSELDEADNEVKWFTDLAFRSLSSPEVDYLDVYNSSHRSSANISQPSTQESPAGVNAAWPAYADFRGSAPKLDGEELPFSQTSAYYSDGLDPSRRYDMGSFECVDVAVEREDSRKVRRGVPKRQIQLKRKDTAEGKHDGSSENSSPGVPVMAESPSLENNLRDTYVRQHSTPAAMQDCYTPESVQQNERNSELQKSASLDDTCTKTKMATCLIKSVLSKKMQSVDTPDEQAEEEVSSAFEENSPATESAISPQRESPKPDAQVLSSSFQSDYSLSSEALSFAREEPSIKDEVKPRRSYGVRSTNRPSSSSSSRSVSFSQTESEDADSPVRSVTSQRSEMRSKLKVPLESNQSRGEEQRANDSKSWDGREAGDSANASAGNTGVTSATGVSSMQARETNRDQECENTEDHKQLQLGDKGAYTSKTQEITLKAVEKKKASLNVCLTPEAEIKPEASSPDRSYREQEEKEESSVDEKTEEEEGNGNNQVKVPLHKVRDVRQLVKNKYNLSFKASSAAVTSDVTEKRVAHFNEEGREEIRSERREDVIKKEEMEVTHAARVERDEFMVEGEEEQKEEMQDPKLLTSTPPPQGKGNPLSRPQPMQIEYKAVCWKEDKNKTLCHTKDSDNVSGTPQTSPKHAVVARPCLLDLNMATEAKEIESHKVPDSEDKPAVIRTDRKPPMLGSLPRTPSKEREVSTAVVLIRDGPSKTKPSASPAQEEIPTLHHTPAASRSPGPTGSSGHSVSMLLKEKGYHADIGAVVGDSHNTAGAKGPPRKHVNSLEIPLQTTTASDGGRTESQRERTFSSSSNLSGPTAVCDNTDTLTKTREEGVTVKPIVKDTTKQNTAPLLKKMPEQTPPANKQKEVGDFEAVKRIDPTFPPRSPAIRRFRPQPIEVKSLSKETQKEEPPTTCAANNRPQTIEVKSIAKNSQKPVVPPKPSCKFKPAELGAVPHEAQKPSAAPSTVKPQSEDRPHTIVVSSPTIYRKIYNDSASAGNYTRKLAVSTVSSLKPPPSKTSATAISSLSNQSTAPAETEAPQDRGQQGKTRASPQPNPNSNPSPTHNPNLNPNPSPTHNSNLNPNASPTHNSNLNPNPVLTHNPNLSLNPKPMSNASSSHNPNLNLNPNNNPKPSLSLNLNPNPNLSHNPNINSNPSFTQRPTTLATAPALASEPGFPSAPGPVSDPTTNQVPVPASAGASQPIRPAAADPDSQPQYPRMSYRHDQAMPATSNTIKPPAPVSTTQVPGYTHQTYRRSFSGDHSQRADDMRIYASDDPPSYDERESFSPLLLPDLTPRRSNRYQPSSRPPPCSCTTGCPSHPGLTPPHHHRSPHSLTPPAPSHSPGQTLPYPLAPPPLRTHQCRPDPQQMSYQPASPKSSPLGPSQPPAMYQPLHQPPPCPPHPSLVQACPVERPMQPPQHMDSRRPPIHRSPGQQPPGLPGAPYNDPGHSHSPGLPPMDPQYLCGPQSLGPSYGSEYGGDSSSLYSESSYAQTPRRVLLDPETGKYFYIEVPVQPLRKMLFDPETGQYVEVLIPQQAMSQSGLYPPSAAPYSSLHNPNMYAPAPQYMPYGGAPPSAHPQPQPQPPRYPEASTTAAMHPGGPGVSYRNPSGPAPKPETQNHPPLDQSYLESMYYVPTGMNASPNPTPPDYYHKHPPNLPPTGGKRS